MTARVVLADVVAEALDAATLTGLVDDPRAGAVVSFVGVVRNHDGGRAVDAIRYEGHPDATAVMAGICSGFLDRDGVCAVLARHRVGDLVVGDAAVVLAVAAEHRAEAFAACSDLIDQIKHSLPIWKRQRFSDGTAEWTSCL